ncbi:MAG: HAD family hydrolase [Pseudomonadota bacterium]
MEFRKADYDAVTFDVYGTLLNWEPEIAAFLGSWAHSNGLVVGREELLGVYDALRQPIQDARPALLYPEVLARTFDGIAAHYQVAANPAMRTAFAQSACHHPAYPDAQSALAALRGAGFVLGALSNIDETSFAAATGAAGLAFDIVVTAERVGAYKPDHLHFQTALADLAQRGVPQARVLHVAQSRRADVVPCNALGITSVWVERPGHVFGRSGAGAGSAQPDAVVGSLAELINRLDI